MAVELESVMERLDAQAKRLKERSRGAGAGDDAALTAQSLAVVSEAILRIGRDLRLLRLQLADKA